MGRLPTLQSAAARYELYAGCTSRLVSSDQPGTRFERLTRNLAPGTYRVRVRVPSGAASLSPFALRVLVIQHKVGLESVAIRSSAGTVRVAGQLVNGTGGTLGPVAVTATFRDAQGRIVGRLSGTSFAYRLAAGAVTPFALTGSVPAIASFGRAHKSSYRTSKQSTPGNSARSRAADAMPAVTPRASSRAPSPCPGANSQRVGYSVRGRRNSSPYRGASMAR